ncbi:hypothetical protein [Actinomycetospora flava]|uniref:Uncharacterized protein n=1 Tax=Actinomycetospora flava TaxID=3129232 RepID=A0ABU8M7D9_9PSEU
MPETSIYLWLYGSQMTPIWVPLVVGALGLAGSVLGTIVGVAITQRRSDRREEVAWQRERLRQQELWSREDLLRNFDAKREATVSFYEELREMSRTVYDHGMGLSAETPSGAENALPFGWNSMAFQRIERLRVYTSPEVLARADDAYNACWIWGESTKRGEDDEVFYSHKEEFDDAELLLYDSIRRDLGLSPAIENGYPIAGSGWGPFPVTPGPEDIPT